MILTYYLEPLYKNDLILVEISKKTSIFRIDYNLHYNFNNKYISWEGRIYSESENRFLHPGNYSWDIDKTLKFYVHPKNEYRK